MTDRADHHVSDNPHRFLIFPQCHWCILITKALTADFGAGVPLVLFVVKEEIVFALPPKTGKAQTLAKCKIKEVQNLESNYISQRCLTLFCSQGHPELFFHQPFSLK